MTSGGFGNKSYEWQLIMVADIVAVERNVIIFYAYLFVSVSQIVFFVVCQPIFSSTTFRYQEYP